MLDREARASWGSCIECMRPPGPERERGPRQFTEGVAPISFREVIGAVHRVHHPEQVADVDVDRALEPVSLAAERRGSDQLDGAEGLAAARLAPARLVDRCRRCFAEESLARADVAAPSTSLRAH